MFLSAHPWLYACVLSCSLFLAGCGGGDDEEEVGGPDVEGCEHLEEGPARPVQAAVNGASAPEVDDDHHRYDIVLVDVAGGKGGSVRFAASAAASYVFFLGQDVPLAITTADLGSVESVHTAGSVSCSQVKGRTVATLEVGTYVLTFGPTAEESVSLVVEKE